VFKERKRKPLILSGERREIREVQKERNKPEHVTQSLMEEDDDVDCD
jgi:hypothetical protein